jgi:hypothetical protein
MSSLYKSDDAFSHASSLKFKGWIQNPLLISCLDQPSVLCGSTAGKWTDPVKIRVSYKINRQYTQGKF